MGLIKRLGLTKLLGSKRTKQLSALSMLAQAGNELRKGNPKLAVLYVAGAVVSYKNTTVGFAMQALLRLFGRGERTKGKAPF
jgi:Fe-S oxidoreductase